MQYDPKLKMAIAEIKEILKKYDVGALVCLHGEKQISEFLNHISPKYSAAYWDEKGRFRVRSKLSDYNGDRSAQEKHLGDTVNMLVHFRNFAGRTKFLMETVIAELKRDIDIEEGPSNFMSDKEINN